MLQTFLFGWWLKRVTRQSFQFRWWLTLAAAATSRSNIIQINKCTDKLNAVLHFSKWKLNSECISRKWWFKPRSIQSSETINKHKWEKDRNLSTTVQLDSHEHSRAAYDKLHSISICYSVYSTNSNDLWRLPFIFYKKTLCNQMCTITSSCKRSTILSYANRAVDLVKDISVCKYTYVCLTIEFMRWNEKYENKKKKKNPSRSAIHKSDEIYVGAVYFCALQAELSWICFTVAVCFCHAALIASFNSLHLRSVKRSTCGHRHVYATNTANCATRSLFFGCFIENRVGHSQFKFN